MVEPDPRRRVKLYLLNADRQWVDRGTGHVTSSYVERLKGVSLIVRSETDGTILLESKIQPDTAYTKQQETLIVWSEAENYDLALSFQEGNSCEEVWAKICAIQGRDPSVEVTQDIIEESEDEHFEEMPVAASPIELPPCELSRLEEISELLSHASLSPVRKEKFAQAIESEGYIKQLLDLFHVCEDLENLDGLHHLYEIFKSIFLLNRNELFEIMFADNTIFDVVGVLEYNPSQPLPDRHREYLKNIAKFKEVIPICKPELLNKIHQTYRVQYIQDVILPTPSVFEENILSTLTSFLFFNKVEIVGMIQEEENFLPSLFAQLTDDETDDEHRRDLVLFLKEFCTFSQTLQPQSRENFFKTLSNLGVLSALELILGLEDEKMKSAAIDIFSYIVEFSPSMVREFILKEGQSQDDDDLLINLVIEQMINDTDPELGGAVQLMATIKLLIDPENMLPTSNKTEKTEFLGFFYKRSMHVLTAPLFANTVAEMPSKDDFQTAQLQSLILELLTFCVEHHAYHIKNYIISKDLLRRVLVLLKSGHAFVALCALRFMRRIIGLKDEFYNRYITKGCLFKPVVMAFLENGNRYNLVNSAMIDLFEFIKSEDIKTLCSHIVENHMKDLETVSYVNTFKNLKARYDQQQDRLKDKPCLDGATSLLQNNRFRRDARTLEEEEEMWFEQDDDVDDSEPIVPMNDVPKSKLDADLDQINRFLESKKVREASDSRDSPPRIINKSISIALKTGTLNNSPVNSPHGSPGSPGSPPGSPSPVGTPCPTPNCSPQTPTSSPQTDQNSITQKRPGLVGLVDYPDEDSEEEDEDEVPTAKRQRIAT
ncbi:hypothetical protein FSP39_017545 [Pinctada imbricata]|uniref:Serine/threonine-protein phosphatase 4 regulatory subunit 3-like central domain-containing protein n=1 Tax=Pinctada imbricata TaxID=66713 RepID=A0AA88XW37_PINIB|nr:hypothetical protein FSP39_017545 [Pinctada imbricata]